MLLKINQILELEILELAQGGEGIAKLDNFIVFVPQGLPGDLVKAKVISTKPTYARALIDEIVKPSELRVKPKCLVTKECGGCQWQELTYEKQLEFKEKNLLDNLIRIGELPLEDLEKAQQKIIGMDYPYYYRNKAQFPFSQEKNKIKGGFYAPKSHNIIEFDKCWIQNDKINHIFRKVKSLLDKYDIPIYNEKTKKGLFKHLVVRFSIFTNQALIGFVTTSTKFPKVENIIGELHKEFPEIVGIIQNINSKDTNVILGDKNITLFGQDHILEKLDNLFYKISLHSFFQVNPIQTIKLYSTVLEFADLKGEEVVLDAYAGAGSISLWLARFSKKVIGIEVVKEAVENGIENSKINNITNFVFKQGKVEDIIPDVLEQYQPDLIVLDPPRKGCEDYIFDSIESSNAKKVIYVSCNPATLARDAKLLYNAGYTLEKFQPVDMFPHTYHLETVALFVKN
jgi:23S rRNA (uracil1939-C5)-methyltransferase